MCILNLCLNLSVITKLIRHNEAILNMNDGNDAFGSFLSYSRFAYLSNLVYVWKKDHSVFFRCTHGTKISLRKELLTIGIGESKQLIP